MWWQVTTRNFFCEFLHNTHLNMPFSTLYYPPLIHSQTQHSNTCQPCEHMLYQHPTSDGRKLSYHTVRYPVEDKVGQTFLSALNCNNNSTAPQKELVVNISDHILSPEEHSVLAKGMKFCPTPGEPNFGALREDLNQFHSRIERHLFFCNLPDKDEGNIPDNYHADMDDSSSDPKFKNPSKWKPPPVSNLELYCRQCEVDLLTHKVPPTKFHNLSTAQKNLHLKNWAKTGTLSLNRPIKVEQW